jgi:tRNA 2-thiocytidine biosynthesis protein TtcA
MDAGLFDFKRLRATGQADTDGDIAFDEEPCLSPAPAAPDTDPDRSVALVRFAEDD